MIIKSIQDLSIKETEITIKYANLTKEVERTLAILQSFNAKIKCSLEGSEKLVNVSDVYYFESVDKMTFAYCEKEVYKTELRLYQVVEDYARMGFVQISKSCVLNINVLDSITPLLNSRMEAKLINRERLLVTRNYIDGIKQSLQGSIQS